jgi:hypothetical protein
VSIVAAFRRIGQDLHWAGGPFKPFVGLNGASSNSKPVSELAFRGSLNQSQGGLPNAPDLVK